MPPHHWTATQHAHVEDLRPLLGVEGDAVEDHADGSFRRGENVHKDNVFLSLVT